jgi:murein DD-endopeptidase MepM/ murein hydrolase activator NlpD
MRVRLLFSLALVPLVLVVADVATPTAAPQAGAATIDDRIDATRGRIGRHKAREKVLTGSIAGYTGRIETVQEGIDRIAAREAVAQQEYDAERSDLDRLQQELRAERERLVRLRKRLAEARRVLSDRLAELYQADKPDLVSVVLNSKGFADLLERGEFISRINAQDQQILRRVRTARADAAGTVVRLDRLEERQAAVTRRIQARRDEISALKQQRVDARSVLDRARNGKESTLQSIREDRKGLEGHLEGLEKEQAKVQASLADNGGAAPSGAFKGSGGPLSMPVNGTFSSPFGYRWGRLHAGVDIAAPEGTPIHAADSGRVVLLGWTGGYGNYTCIQHTASMSTCYGHQSRYGTTMGAGVRRGQLIGYVGNTGHSFGAHLHFEVRINGTPQDPMGYL